MRLHQCAANLNVLLSPSPGPGVLSRVDGAWVALATHLRWNEARRLDGLRRGLQCRLAMLLLGSQLYRCPM